VLKRDPYARKHLSKTGFGPNTVLVPNLEFYKTKQLKVL
jgi:hypothetical protein